MNCQKNTYINAIIISKRGEEKQATQQNTEEETKSKTAIANQPMQAHICVIIIIL
jgi:hypothetical protein